MKCRNRNLQCVVSYAYQRMATEPGLDVLWIYKYFHIQFCTQTIKADLPGLQPCSTTCQDTPSKSHASQEEPAPPRLQDT